MNLKRFNSILLGIIPLVFILVSFLFKDSIDSYHYTMMDPEYIYLMNGVVANEKHLQTDFYDCPGTPMVVYTAIIERIVNFFRNTPLMEDVIKNPEMYLDAVNLVSNIILVFIIFLGGLALYNRSKNLLLALLFQSSIFLYDIPSFTSRVFAETIALFFIYILIFQVISYLELKPEEEKVRTRFAVFFAITIGILTATKISIFPLFFIPLIMLKKAKDRIIFSSLTIVFFLIFAYPVLLHMHTFYKWVKAMFMHSGRYGGGENKIVSIPDFMEHLKMLYNTYRLVFYQLFVNISIIVVIAVIRIRKKIPIPEDRYKAIIGVTLCYIIQIISIGKHFAFHYFLPSLMITTLNVYLLITFIFGLWKFRYIQLTERSLYLLAIILIGISMYRYVTTDTRIRYESMGKREKTTNFIFGKLSDHPVVINTEPWNPCPEAAVWFGSLFTRRYRPILLETLNRTYPNRYFYVDQYGCYIDWNSNQLKINDIISKHDSVYYICNRLAGNSEADPVFTRNNDSLVIDTLFSFPERSEIIALLRKKQ
jgi:hypothetical protein